MNSSTFDTLRAQLAFDRENIVIQKRPEYTEGNVDVLNNFKILATELGITPIQVWYVYFRKHVASIGQFAASPTRTMSEPIIGRIADAMNYLDLLNALIQETTLSEFAPIHEELHECAVFKCQNKTIGTYCNAHLA